MKNLIMVMTLMGSLASQAQVCPKIEGTYNKCTTGDKFLDQEHLVPKKIMIKRLSSQERVGFDIQYKESSGIKTGEFFVNETEQKEIDVRGWKSLINITAKCEKNALEIDYKFDSVVRYSTILSEELYRSMDEVLASEFEGGPHRLALKGKTLTFTDKDLGLPIKCRKIK